MQVARFRRRCPNRVGKPPGGCRAGPVCGLIPDMNRDSDLIAIPYILGLFLAVIVVTAAFFLVGAVAGLVTLIIAMVVIGFVAYRGLGSNPDQ